MGLLQVRLVMAAKPTKTRFGVTKTRFDSLCGRNRETARLIERGETPEPLFEIPSPRTDQDAGPARRETQPRNPRS